MVVRIANVKPDFHAKIPRSPQGFQSGNTGLKEDAIRKKPKKHTNTLFTFRFNGQIVTDVNDLKPFIESSSYRPYAESNHR